MPAPLEISLTAEEDRTLKELSSADGVPRRTKTRATAVRLNAHGWTAPKIATYLEQTPATVRQTLRRWQNQGLGGLWEAPGRGGQQRWSEADIKCVEQWLSEERTYTSRQLSEQLAQQRQVHLGTKQLSCILKKRGAPKCGKLPHLGPGSERARHLHKPKTLNASKQNIVAGKC